LNGSDKVFVVHHSNQMRLNRSTMESRPCVQVICQARCRKQDKGSQTEFDFLFDVHRFFLSV